MLYRNMSAVRRRHLAVVLVFVIGAAAAEMAMIGAVLPFATALSGAAPASVLPAWLSPGSWAETGSLSVASTMLIAAAVAAAVMRLLLMRVSQGFALQLGHDMGVTIFGRVLRQPYARYLEGHSSDILSAVEKIQTLVASVLQPLVQSCIAALIALGILAVLVLVSPAGTATAAAVVGGAYLSISFAARRRLSRNSAELSRLSRERIKVVQEALGAIREILLSRCQTVFETRFRQLDGRFRKAQAANLFAAGAPRYLVEAAGIAALALAALVTSARPGGLAGAVPLLAALALGAHRLLPLLQQIYFGWSQTTGNRHSLGDVVALMEMPVVDDLPPGTSDPLPFTREIVFDGVSFEYPGRETALHGVNLTIPHGARFGVAGPTGSGKSTLIDLLLGLLEPAAGEIRIDGQALNGQTRAAWQAKIAHVPQSVSLADESIAANIAFGTPPDRIDMDRVGEAARLAQLEAFIAALPEGYRTEVGERGLRLSGGERQRIGIARALYMQPQLLILDEATSALDDDTEAAVLAALESLEQLTILIVAHRKTGLAICEDIVWLKQEGSFPSRVPEGVGK